MGYRIDEEEVLNLFFRENKKPAQIAQKVKTSRQRVHQIIQKEKLLRRVKENFLELKNIKEIISRNSSGESLIDLAEEFGHSNVRALKDVIFEVKNSARTNK